MTAHGQRALDCLLEVERLREERASDPLLAERVTVIKTYQANRFARTYQDLLESPRYKAAARFFLEELYGPTDYSQRDAQFARIVPTLSRMLPENLIQTVSTLGELHALTETLDTTMAKYLESNRLGVKGYKKAWRSCGQHDARSRQIDYTLKIGMTLDRYCRSKMIQASLRLMRQPATAAGLGQLQQFLEAGLAAFSSLKGARGFLEIVRSRETAFVTEMFDDTGHASA